MKIGPYIFDTPVILAPMAGVTDRPFRQLCKDLGASLAVSEMVGANSFLHGSEKTARRADHEGETRPVSVQILGADPKMMGEAAALNEAQGAEIIDINMGCPAKKVCNTLAGSALLKDESLVGRILTSVVSSVKIPVTLKIRTGWDKNNRNGIRIAKIAKDCGIQALAVHGRTRACRFMGEAEFETIQAIKAEVDLPIIANGDITTPERALEVLKMTQADGIMIGRAAQGHPWIFREIRHFIATGEKLAPPTNQEIREILLKHLHNLYGFYGHEKGLHIARKHVLWYSKGRKNSAFFRQTFNHIETSEGQLEAIDAFFSVEEE